MSKLFHYLDSKRLFQLLVGLNAVVACVVFYFFYPDSGGDEYTYIGLADGIEHGSYSFWWFLPGHYPDTFRNPGYPLFLWLLRKFSDEIVFIQLVQLVLYFFTVWLTLILLKKYSSGFALKNVFLILLLPSMQFAHAATLIMPDCVTAFLVMALMIVYEKIDESRWWKYALVGLLYGVIFQLRPVFLLFPLFKLLADAIFLRRGFPVIRNAVALFVFLITTLPYGFWNYKHHGVFTLTCLEGGGGVFQNGYWSFKIPGHIDDRYWFGNRMSDEWTPFSDDSNKDANVAQFNRQWDYIDSACAQFKTQRDTLLFAAMSKHWRKVEHYGLCITQNTQYTLERERLLTEITWNRYKSDWQYALKTRLYTLVRVWVTGVQRSAYHHARGLEKVKVVYPFAISAFVFFLSLILIPLAFARKKMTWVEFRHFILLLFYFGLIHLPFAIQARYTIPVRLLLIMLLSVAFYRLYIIPRAEKKPEQSL